MKNFKLPSPRWFRITKKIISWATNLTIGCLVIYIPEESKTLIIAKLIQSSITELLDSFMAELETESNNEEN